MTGNITLSIAVGATGAQPTPPATINQNLVTLVSGVDPGYTVLPAGLVEDLSSTATYAVALIDSAVVDLINSLTPFTANPWLLSQLGDVYGVPQGADANTSALVVFSGSIGFIVEAGFVVSDGTHQYIAQEGDIVGSGGSTNPVFCVAVNAGTWTVPVGTVTTLVTSLPPGVVLTCTNPNTGTPSPGPETEEGYRARVLQSGLTSAQGNQSFAKALLSNVPGVQPRLISVAQINGGGWEVIVGGGDPFAVGFAIYSSGLDISTLVGSTIQITGITKANPGVVATDINHGLLTGQANVHIAGVVGMASANGGPYTVTVIDQTHFSFGVNTTSFGTYVSGGVVTPNARNVTVNVNDYPDTYTIPFVDPPEQTVAIQLTWNTSSPFAVSDVSVAQLGAPALASYINSIAVGVPINLFELQAVFQVAVVSLIPTPFLTRMVFTVSINGVNVSPAAGTGVIAGDPESYFFCQANNVTITQG